TACAFKQGNARESELQKLDLLMQTLKLEKTDRAVVAPALDVAGRTGEPAIAIELNDGRIITGKTSSLLGASSAGLLNALKALAGIPDEIKLISPTVIEPICHLKVEHMGNRNPRLHTDETLVALAVSAATDANADRAMDQLVNLKGCEAHSTVILSQVDEGMFGKLGVNITCEPTYQTKRLYHK
ncbi:MAG: DUF1846 family C-terminal domain-containing protein, partial [bacterium]